MRPMLCEDMEDENKIIFPAYVSPKINGIRCLIKDGVARTRSLKPIPNHFVRDILSNPVLEGLEGELTIGKVTDKSLLENTTSAITTYGGNPEFSFHIYDYFTYPDLSFRDRLAELNKFYDDYKEVYPYLKLVSQTLVNNIHILKEYEKEFVNAGYEGLILKTMTGKYKYGRSTEEECLYLRIKRFIDSEAIITGYNELYYNQNVANINRIGLIERSDRDETLTPASTLGSLIVRDLYTNLEFNIAGGFNEIMRKKIWDNKEYYLGKIVKYSYHSVGSKSKPRNNKFLAFRDPIDLIL